MYRYIDVGTHLRLPNSTRSRIEMGLFCSGEPPRPAPFLLLYYYFFWMYCTHVIEVENMGSCPMNYSKCNYKQQFSMCQEPFLEPYSFEICFMKSNSERLSFIFSAQKHYAYFAAWWL